MEVQYIHRIYSIGQNHIFTVYIWYFRQENHQIYGRWQCIYTVLASPSYDATHSEDEALHSPPTFAPAAPFLPPPNRVVVCVVWCWCWCMFVVWDGTVRAPARKVVCMCVCVRVRLCVYVRMCSTGQGGRMCMCVCVLMMVGSVFECPA
jgi:hypothetical protein